MAVAGVQERAAHRRASVSVYPSIAVRRATVCPRTRCPHRRSSCTMMMIAALGEAVVAVSGDSLCTIISRFVFYPPTNGPSKPHRAAVRLDRSPIVLRCNARLIYTSRFITIDNGDLYSFNTTSGACPYRERTLTLSVYLNLDRSAIKKAHILYNLLGFATESFPPLGQLLALQLTVIIYRSLDHAIACLALPFTRWPFRCWGCTDPTAGPRRGCRVQDNVQTGPGSRRLPLYPFPSRFPGAYAALRRAAGRPL